MKTNFMEPFNRQILWSHLARLPHIILISSNNYDYVNTVQYVVTVQCVTSIQPPILLHCLGSEPQSDRTRSTTTEQ